MDAAAPIHEAWAPVRRELAPAKINLALHVTGRRPDGYHTLDSLVVFAADGDTVRVAPAAADSLHASGPFAADLPPGRDNIVLRALDLVREVAAEHGMAIGPQRVELDKRLPLASGIGGGSADAAALMRALLPDAPAALRREARRRSLRLGADVPMCLDGFAARVAGIGEIAEPVAVLPRLAMLLVNPGLAVSTPAAFAALGRRDNPPLTPLPPEGFGSLDALAALLAAGRNDLEAPALGLVPAIGRALALLREAGAVFARMSGSGATVFGLFRDDAACRAAADFVSRREPAWWALATHVPATGAAR